MAEETTIVSIKLEVDNREAVEEIRRSELALKDLKDAEEELRQERKSGAVTIEEYYEKLTEIRSEMERQRQNRQAYTKVLKDNIKQERTEVDSLNALRAELNKTLKAYDNMSKAEREGAKGQDMLNHIKELTDEVSTMEESTGRFQRNVGNYQSALEGLPRAFGRLSGSLENVTTGNGNFLKSIGSSITGIFRFITNIRKASIAAGGFGKALKLLALSNPFGILLTALTAVIGVFAKLRSKAKEAAEETAKANEEAARKAEEAWQKAYENIKRDAENVADAAMSFEGGRSYAEIEALKKLNEASRKYTQDRINEEYWTVVESRDKIAEELVKMEQQGLQSSKEYLEKRKQFDKAAIDVITISYAEAKTRQEQASRNANKVAAEDAKQRYKAEAERADKETEVWVKSYADALAAQKRAEEERRKQQQAAAKEQNDAAKTAADSQKARQQAELTALRTLEDMRLALLADGRDKEVAIAKETANRKIEDIRRQLKEETTLTLAARKALNEQITLLEAQLQIDIMNIDIRYEEEAIAKRDAAEKQRMEDADKQAEIELLRIKNTLDARLMAVKNNAIEEAKIRKEQADAELKAAKDKYQAIKDLDADQAASAYASVKDYELALETANAEVIAAANAAKEAEKGVLDTTKEMNKQVTEAQQKLATEFAGLAGNMQGLFELLAKENSDYASAAKAMGLMQLLISSAVSIAKAIEGATTAAAASGPAAPFLVAGYITEMVATVTAAIASARQLLTEANAAFATGGVVHGAGTGTSDSITARVSNGEAIMTAKATAMFYDQLSAMNVAGGGRPFDRRGGNRFATGGVVSTQTLSTSRSTADMARAVTEAVANIHPVVSVKEITRMQGHVQLKEQIARQ